jgi:hypothetical protein
VLAAAAAGALFGVCGPFTDVSDAGFCPFVLELFTLGITTGTTPTTYAPADNVTRLQMAAFLSRSVDGTLKRGNRRAALNRFWTPQGGSSLGMTNLAAGPGYVASDGPDLWTTNSNNNTVSRVRAGDGKLLETWTGALGASGVLTAIGRVFVTGASVSAQLYRIDPAQPAGAVTTVASNLGNGAGPLAFDGSRIWSADFGGSVSIATPGPGIPYSVSIAASGFTSPNGILFDGGNIWVTDFGAGTLLKLDSNGTVLQTVTVGTQPMIPLYDGTNIWVPGNNSNSVTVVRPSTGAVLATLTGNGLNGPWVPAFDGERVLVTNYDGSSVSLWKAANLTPIGTFSTGSNTHPLGSCSDGLNFWIVLNGTTLLARF